MAYVQQPQVSAYAQSDYGKMAGEQFFKHDSGKKHYVPVNSSSSTIAGRS